MKAEKKIIKEFEDMLNKAKIGAYFKKSLEEPLNEHELKEYKKSIYEYYGLKGGEE